ncbi:MAG: DUF2849 domain-containing protein [Pseudomonadota bacterium]
MAKRPPDQPKVMTANCLTTGAILYLGPKGAWTRDFSEAAVTGTAEDAAALTERAATAEAQGLVVSAYLLPVTLTDQGPQPLGQRERIRAAGPSIDLIFQPAKVR